MKKYEIVCDWLCTHLHHLSRSQAAETFAGGLRSPELERFADLAEVLDGYRERLEAAKHDRAFFTDFTSAPAVSGTDSPSIHKSFQELSRHFPMFPNLLRLKTEGVLLFAQKIVDDLPQFDESDIDITRFTLHELPDNVPATFFAFSNSTDPLNSIVFASFTDLDELTKAVAGNPLPEHLLYTFAGALVTYGEILPKQYALVRTDHTIGNAAVSAFVKLQIVASGKPVHEPKIYHPTPTIANRDAFNVQCGYHQLNETINVLSEYNSRQELLTKFLTLYHVIENFVFKVPIVDMVRRWQGKMFSIREFRRLYKRVDKEEMEALRGFFQKVFKDMPLPANTFEQRITGRWLSLVPRLSAVEVEKLMQLLDISKDGSPLKHSEFQKQAGPYFAQIIYAVRNAIVHNKETELHLTYANLEPAMATLIEDFVIPSLEELSFHLVGTTNNHVWYSTQQIVLYQ